MNCSIVNARPQNMSIDANGSYDNRAFKFTFYGDRTIGADFYIYNMNTNALWNGTIYSDYAASNSKKYYYNTEEIDVHVGAVSSNNNKEFIWKTRVYDDIDISSGKLPNIVVTNGAIKDNPFLTGTLDFTNSPAISGDTYLFIGTGLNITLPSWIYVGTQTKRIILAYNSEIGVIKLKNAFDTPPVAGDAWAISPERNVAPIVPTANQTFIANGIGINGKDKDHRNAFKISVDYPTTPQYCYYLMVEDNYYTITDYDTKTGLLTCAEDVSALEVDKEYTLYSSFVESPMFYFSTEPTPIITNLTLTEYGEVLKCKADFVSKSYVKYQYWEIFDVTGDTDLLVETSQKMYLGDLEFIFRGTLVGHKYKARLHMITQTNWDIKQDSTEVAITTSLSGNNISSFSYNINENNVIQLSFKHSSSVTKHGGIKILRQEYGSDIIEYVDTKEYTESVSAGKTITFDDYKTGNGIRYKYYLCCYNAPSSTSFITMYSAYTTDWISADFNTYSIYMLQESAYSRYDDGTDKRINYDYMFGERMYKVLQIFRPELNVTDKPKVNHNLGRNTYVGYAQKPSVASWETTYDTFSLSFQLGNTKVLPVGNASQNDIVERGMGYTVLINQDRLYYENWKTAVASGCPVLIKDYRGNMWLGNITTHNTEIDNTTLDSRPITINIDFTEIYPINKVKIIGE